MKADKCLYKGICRLSLVTTIWREYIQRRFIVIQITKDEKEKLLLRDKGFYIAMTGKKKKSHRKKYYLTETPAAVRALAKIRGNAYGY